MYGAILGDILGSIYEFNNLKTDKPQEIDLLQPDCFYTDDSLLTVAIADAVLNGYPYEDAVRKWTALFPNLSYGTRFKKWIFNKDSKPYNSWGNGSAMRVSPIGWLFNDLETILDNAQKTAEFTHNHCEGIKGAQAVAASIFMARNKASKKEIKEYIEKTFKYDLSKTIKEIRPKYTFNESCQETVPQAIIAFLESDDFKSSIQIAISIGGDTDTLACITGSIAESFYKKIPKELIDFANKIIHPLMKSTIDDFYQIILSKHSKRIY